MSISRIDDRFSVSPQIHPADIAEIKRLGFSGIVCARPDGEDAGQPNFAAIARAAEAAGLKAVHIPVSGQCTEAQLIRFQEAMADMPGPVLGYCRSGGRAGTLYRSTR